MGNASSMFSARRKQVFDAMANDSIAILSAASTVYRNADAEYPYRQCSYFHYLTNWQEPNTVAVLIKQGGVGRYVLFCQAKDPAKEQWTGYRQGPEGALAHFDADEAYPIATLTEKMLPWMKAVRTIYYLFNLHPPLEKMLHEWQTTLQDQVREGVHAPHIMEDLRLLLDPMRLIKSNEEQSLLQKACDIASSGHRQAMRRCRPGMWEYEIEAVLLYEFYRQGSRFPAYSSIVAGGDNACILHYVNNSAQLKDNQLLLIDAGAEYEQYASDITRTFPINGRFTKIQQAVYECVLAAQEAALAVAKSGQPWDAMQKAILKVLVSGLIDFKVLKGNVDELIAEKAYAPFYMHNSGHWLGQDVHDVGDYKVDGNWRPLEPGMVLTIEPGLYFNPDDSTVPDDLKGIGIRIEDDVLITTQGPKVLSDVPKTVQEIENWMQGKS